MAQWANKFLNIYKLNDEHQIPDSHRVDVFIVHHDLNIYGSYNIYPSIYRRSSQNWDSPQYHALNIKSCWQCNTVQRFSSEVINFLFNFLGCPIPSSSTVWLLGNTSVLNLYRANNRPLLQDPTITNKTVLIHSHTTYIYTHIYMHDISILTIFNM